MMMSKSIFKKYFIRAWVPTSYFFELGDDLFCLECNCWRPKVKSDAHLA